jgi:hypothetical protein
MRLNRTLLYAGVFLTALGVTLLAVDASSPTTNQLIEALGLWPLVPVAAGLALVLRRTSFSLSTGLLAAAVPGLVLGGLLALSPRLAVEHGVWNELRTLYERSHHYCSDIDSQVDFGNVHIPMGGCS